MKVKTKKGNVIGYEEDGTLEILIPSGATGIGPNAFSNCKMKSIDIPESVLKIDSNAFDYCSDLETINLSNELRFINKQAFFNCVNLKQILFPPKLEKIFSFAFAGCEGLTYIDVPKSIKIIGAAAFYNCPNLVVNLPDDLDAKIGWGAFISCKEIRFKSYNVFRQLDSDSQQVGFKTVIINYYLDKSYYTKEELEEFYKFLWDNLSELLLRNRSKIIEEILKRKAIIDFMFEIDCANTTKKFHQLNDSFFGNCEVTAFLMNYLHTKLESMGLTETDVMQNELTLEDYTPEELEQMNNNGDEDEMKQGL